MTTSKREGAKSKSVPDSVAAIDRPKPAGVNTAGYGSDIVKAVLAYEKKVGMEPADSYVGLKVLARLRQAS